MKPCTNGSSELMSSISSSVVSMVYNFQLLKYIGEDGVSAYGVLMYVQFIFVAIYIGYSVGCAPVIGYHYGAGNRDELKNLLRKSALLIGSAGVLLTLLARLLASPLASIFVGYDETLHALTEHAFRLFSFSFLLSGFNIFTSAFFTALNNAQHHRHINLFIEQMRRCGFYFRQRQQLLHQSFHPLGLLAHGVQRFFAYRAFQRLLIHHLQVTL